MESWKPSDLQENIETGKPVFLKLWKKGCGTCKLSIPALERIEAADKSGIVFGKINVEDHPEILEIAEADVVPSFFIFKDKQMAGQYTGFKGMEKMAEFIAQAMAAKA